MADDLKSVVNDAREALANVRAEIEKGGFKGFLGGLFNRFPAGTAKGGQFAPKGQSGGGKDGLGDQHDAAHPGKKTPIPGSVPHPQKDNHGDPVHVNYPSKASAPDTWTDATKTATFVPGQENLPTELNGVKFTNAQTPADWSKVRGQNPKLDADMPFEAMTGMSTGAGVIILEPDGRMWLTKPTNEFGGYKNTFPKGTVEPQLTMQQNAIKEAFEETGLQVKITGVLGDFERTTSKARFYIAERIGGSPKNMGWESQAVRLAPMKDAAKLLNRSVDRNILDDLEHLMSFGKSKGGAWTTQPRWPAGSPLGGQWKAMGSDGITLPPKLANGLDGKNPIYQATVNAVHAAAQSGSATAAHEAMEKYAAHSLKFSNGQLTSSHVKWGAGVYQYAAQVKADLQNKVKAGAAVDRINGVTKLSSYGASIGPKPGGSNPGGMYADGTAKVLVKGNKQLETGQQSKMVSDLRAHNEVLAAKLLQGAGVGAPDMKLVDLEGKYGGGLGVASTMVTGVQKFDPGNGAHVQAARDDFAVHAWLGNYDVLGMGYDNTVIKNGQAVNIDPGGALLFRAQGALKDPSNPIGGLKPDAPEFETMRSTSTEQKSVYGGMTASDLAKSAEKLKAISPEQIKTLVDTYGGGDAKFKSDLTKTLVERRAAILMKTGQMQAAKPPEPITPVAVEPKEPKGFGISTADQMVKEVQRYAGQNPEKLSVVDIPKPFNTDFGSTGLAQADKLFAAGDSLGLATHSMVAKGVADSYKPTDESYPTFKGIADYSAQMLVKLEAQKIMAAQKSPDTAAALNAAASAISKPVFQSPYKEADKFYTKMANEFEALHKAGDLSGLMAAKQAGKYQDFDGSNAPWKPGSQAGKKAEAYFTALTNDLQTKQAAATIAGAKKADAALSNPTPAPAPNALVTPNSGAMPDFQKYKLAPNNTNAKSHNPKLNKIEGLALNGDVKGLLSLGFGKNTYAKQQVKLANDALAAMGSPHQVVIQQKPNSHPALHGGVSPATAQKASSFLGIKLPNKSTAPDQVAADQAAAKDNATRKEWLKLAPDEKLVDQGESFGVKWAKIETPAKGFQAGDIPKPPNFFEIGTQGANGKSVSSKPEINQSNNDAVNSIHSIAISHTMPFEQKMKMLSDFKVDVLGPDMKPASQVPVMSSKAAKVKEYHAQVVAELKAQQEPGFKTVQSGSFTGAYKQATETMAKVYDRTPYADFKKAERAADYVVLSKDGAANLPAPQAGLFKEMKSNDANRQKILAASKAAYATLSPAQKQAITAYTGNSYISWNDALRNGSVGTNSFEGAQTAVKAIAKSSTDIPEGTVLWRGISVGAATYESIVGGVIQDGSFNSSSFGDRPGYGSGHNTWLRIHIATPGVKGVDVTAFGAQGASESEIIIQNNVRYAVLKVTHHKVWKTSSGATYNNKTIVDLIALPHEP